MAKKPNPLKKLLINDEQGYFLFLTEHEKEVLCYSVNLYSKLLQQKGEKNIERYIILENKIFNADNFNV